MPLGSGALATTTYPLDRNMVAEDLGFASITYNSIDSVSDRDYAIEALLSFIHDNDVLIKVFRRNNHMGNK